VLEESGRTFPEQVLMRRLKMVEAQFGDGD
jgi:hypothetical protein